MPAAWLGTSSPEQITKIIYGGAGNFFDDFPFLGLAGGRTRGARLSQATANVLYAASPQSVSFSVDASNPYSVSNGTGAVISTDAWHGFKCLEVTVTVAGVVRAARAISVTRGLPYTVSSWLNAAIGKGYRCYLASDGTGGSTSYSATKYLTRDWQYVTATYTIPSDATYIEFNPLCSDGNGVVGDKVLVDACMITFGSTPLPFVEKEALATNVSVPLSGLLTAGLPFSVVLGVWSAWAGDDGLVHNMLDTRNTGFNGFDITKSNDNTLRFTIADNVGTKFVYKLLTSALWPAGSSHVLACSADSANNLNYGLDGLGPTGTVGATGRELSLGTTLALGRLAGGLYPLDGTLDAFILPGYAFTAEECVAASSLKTWMSPARDGYMRHMAALDRPRDCLQGVDHFVR
jgi:hypothetical protein